MKKYLNKVKIVEPCDSIISEISILTVALLWSARQGKGSGNSDSTRITKIRI